MSCIVIVGGGMGGASLALLLAQKTAHDILLIEQAALAADSLPDTPSYDARSTALALGSAEILAALGAWDVLKPHAAAIRHINVSHQGHFGAARLDAREENVAALGFVAENRHLGFALLAALRKTRVQVLAPMRIETLRRTAAASQRPLADTHAAEDVHTSLHNTQRHQAGNHTDQKPDKNPSQYFDTANPCWHITLANGESLSADLLIVADGVQSATRDALGVSFSEHDYCASAIVCNVTPHEAHGDIAFERFTADGAIAILPLTGKRCAIVWSLPNERARDLLTASEDLFLATLSEAAGNRLGGFAKVGQRSAYPLIRTLAAEQAVPGAVLLGNAAHLLHPVAGQGFNLTLRDAVALSDVLAAAEKNGEYAGDLSVLLRYVQMRARDQHLTAGLSHGLPKVFTSDAPLLATARDLGLLAFDIATPLKREFARQAMGIGVFTGGVSRAAP